MTFTSCWLIGKLPPLRAQPFKIYHNPLINWLWTGAFVFIFGTLVAAWPDKVSGAAPVIVKSAFKTAGAD